MIEEVTLLWADNRTENSEPASYQHWWRLLILHGIRSATA